LNTRLDELRAHSSSQFDFKKLIRLCKKIRACKEITYTVRQDFHIVGMWMREPKSCG